MKLPKLLQNKLYKTGQTRGADDDVIYQNRVGRNSTVLIPFSQAELCLDNVGPDGFENGYIVLVNPIAYQNDPNVKIEMARLGLVIGENALFNYETREQWSDYNPLENGLVAAKSRTKPLLGQFIARIPSTTSEDGEMESHGYNSKKMKGAGIRVMEYAPSEMIKATRIQLEFLFWKCADSAQVLESFGFDASEIREHREKNEELAMSKGLGNMPRLIKMRILDENENTICPLCIKKLSAKGFFNKVAQAAGREVSDLTVTELNLFHIKELVIGSFNHTTYNLGWGHHHCNVVTKDVGIIPTLKWMQKIVDINIEKGYLKDTHL